MIKTMNINPGEIITEEERIRFSAEVEKAKSMPEVFDEDCHELSPAMVKAFRCIAVKRNRNKKAWFDDYKR